MKRVAIAAGLVAMHGCHDASGPSVADDTAVAVTIIAPVADLESGEVAQYTAIVRDGMNRAIPGAVVTWSVSDPAVLSINDNGGAIARPVAAAAVSLVIATHGPLADSLPVSVAPPAFPTLRQPILFIHGFGGSAQDFDPVIARFRVDGWHTRELQAATYSSSISNADVAGQIAAQVDSVRLATGWDKVHIVAYSMGSLSSRYYLKNLGGTQWVDSWSSISGPNHGTTTANLCDLAPCIEMRPNSSFLTALNADDETPGDVRYATWWSPCDDVVIPPSSTVLSGATNTEAACTAHADMFTETNYEQVRDFIRP